MSDNCLFCRIVSGDIPATRVAETDDAIAFRDVNPVAPVHVLVVPRRHVDSLDAADDEAKLAIRSYARPTDTLTRPRSGRGVPGLGACHLDPVGLDTSGRCFL